MANIVDQLVVVLELDSAKFVTGIQQAMSMLQGLSGAVKSVDASVVGFSKGMVLAGNVSGVASEKARNGFMRVGQSLNSANAALDKFKRNMQTGESGALREVSRGTGEIKESLGGVVSGGILANIGLRGLIRTVEKLNETLGVTALKNTLFEVVGKADSTVNVADRFRVDPHVLETWHNLSKMFLGTPQEIDATLTNIVAKVGAVGTKLRGGKQAAEAFKIMGLDPEKMRGEDPLGILKDVAQAYGSGKMGAVGSDAAIQRMAAVKKALGMGNATFDAITQSGELFLGTLENIEKTTERTEELRAGSNAQVSQNELNNRLEALKLKLMQDLLPVMEKFVVLLEDVMGWLGKHPDGASAALYSFSAAITAVSVALKGLLAYKGITFLMRMLGMGGGAAATTAAAGAEGGALAGAGAGFGNTAAAAAGGGGGAVLAIPAALAAILGGGIYSINEAAKAAQASGDYSGWSDEIQGMFGGAMPNLTASMAPRPAMAGNTTQVDFHDVVINAGPGVNGQEIAAGFVSEVHARMRKSSFVAQSNRTY